MFVLGLLGMLMLALGVIVSGWFTVVGMVYCVQPTVIYIFGCLMMC
jgi:hypothetical protein